MSAPALAADPSPPRAFLGRPFVNPVFDAMVIGGGLSLVAVALLAWGSPSLAIATSAISLPGFLLATNLSHFASSTVRLYTKPGTRELHRFLTMGLPLATLLVVTLCVAFADILGPHLQNLYLTWSPYHYAAQAYGLAVMYCYRSSVTLPDPDKKLLRAACLAPFLFAFFRGPSAGIEWFVPAAYLSQPAVSAGRGLLVTALGVISLAAPVALYLRSLRRARPLPLISVLIVGTNAIWWIVLLYMKAFWLATVFHGLQYLAIVTLFHVRERLQAPGNVHAWPYHAGFFYLRCLALAWALFCVWPYAYVLFGFGLAESAILTVAAINVHHFLVDAYIWRLRGDRNYRVVTSALQTA